MFILIELQTNAEGQVGNIVTAYEDANVADSHYYQTLASAAISNVFIHAVTLLNERGVVIRNDCYTHKQEAE